MRAVSSAASLTVHVALGTAILLGTADSARSRPAQPTEVAVLFPRTASASRESSVGSIGVPIPSVPDLQSINVPVTALPSGASMTPFVSVWSPSVTTAGAGQGGSWGGGLGEGGPGGLTGAVSTAPGVGRPGGVVGRGVVGS